MDNKKKILIVDDDSFLLDTYTLRFEKSGFEVVSALGSELALEKLKSGFNPDVMLIDVMMPVMDGFEFIEKIKENNLAVESIKIILSNRGQTSDIEKGKELGVNGCIIKASSTPSEVINQVIEIMNTKNN